MFHVKHPSIPRADHLSVVRRSARWAGVELEAGQEHQLRVFAQWLVGEAIPAGGLGPNEGARVCSRHIADSLLFAFPWKRDMPPATVLDVGAGVGLPGIPLAIAWPTAQVTLLERSARRSDLARRAVRLLDLPNVQVITLQLKQWTTKSESIVCRGVASPVSLQEDFGRLLTPSGRAVIGGSRRSRPLVADYRVIEVPKTIIGNPVWLLSMDGT